MDDAAAYDWPQPLQPREDEECGDRFIPNRSSADLESRFALLSEDSQPVPGKELQQLTRGVNA